MAESTFDALAIGDLFLKEVTRDIPPVVYFHEQSPEKLAQEVSEYIVTGGWPEDHPGHKRVPNGIHEQYVRLLNGISRELKKGGTDLPNVWISGFFGSGKSSFAKLIGLALDGVALPDGRSLAEALLARDTTLRSQELRDAWANLRAQIDPIAVVFDIGAVSRDGEHIHSAAVRQIQARLGYSTKNAHVALGELEIERAGRWAELEALASELFDGRTWAEVRNEADVQPRFSRLMHRLSPDAYPDEMRWMMAHAGTAVNVLSPKEAVVVIEDMLNYRQPGATLFMVIDEVSQYVLSHGDRAERLRAFAEQLGARLKGRVWLLALGQQKLDEGAGDVWLVKTKDRFKPALRIHLATTNIRDVVHERLLKKKEGMRGALRELFEQHRATLKLYAFGCEETTAAEFVETYPMLPGQIDLLLQITTALRTRSTRAQGDDQAIRGLLQLLGELFREQKLAEMPVGSLVTIDQIYEVQHTALDSDVQTSMARILDQCSGDADPMLIRAAKAVAMLELIQETEPTTVELVAKCLYERIDLGNQVSAVREALEELNRRNLLSYSEKTGYKIQSSAGEEWERDRRDIGVGREAIAELIQNALKYSIGDSGVPRIEPRSFPWSILFSDGRQARDVIVVDPRDSAKMRVDFRFLTKDQRIESRWVERSDESGFQERLVWVAGDADQLESRCRELHRSKAMVRKYSPRRESLLPALRLLLGQEENRIEDLQTEVRRAVQECLMNGRLYFRGHSIDPEQYGASFTIAVTAVANRFLPDLYPHFVATNPTTKEIELLFHADLAGLSPKFVKGDLGIFELEAGRYIPTCKGLVPSRIEEFIKEQVACNGTSILAHFGGPPYGYTKDMVRACAIGLLRGGKLRVRPESGTPITSFRDVGAREVFEKETLFKKAIFEPGVEGKITRTDRAKICKLFEAEFNIKMDRQNEDIADAVMNYFPGRAAKLRDVFDRLRVVDPLYEPPKALLALGDAVEKGIARSRQTEPTVILVKQRLDVLRDGFLMLHTYAAELTEEAVQKVRRAISVRDRQLDQLEAVGLGASVAEAASALRQHLAGEKPWRDTHILDGHVQTIVDAYRQERQARIDGQETSAEAARSRVKLRDGFATLTADDSHKVLRPFKEATDTTTADAIAPSLAMLHHAFLSRLRDAEEEANERLDQILEPKNLIVKVDLKLKNVEVKSEQDVDALVNSIRERLLQKIAEGASIRLV